MKLLALSGFVPEQICDVVRFSGYTGERNINHYCGYVNDFISQVQQDRSVDGGVYPKSCDSSRIITSYLEDISKFQFQLNVPARCDESAVSFFARELKRFKECVEKHFQISISEQDIIERTEKINQRNQVIKTVYQRLEEISYGEYLREIHRCLKNPGEYSFQADLPGKQNSEAAGESVSADGMRANTDFPAKQNGFDKHRVYLVGSFLTNVSIADQIEEAGMVVVGDNLPESGRLAGSETDTSGDIYLGIAKELLGRRLSPTQDDFNEILQRDFDEIKAKKAEAVIFIVQKYCEPYEFLYSVYKKKLDAEGIPSLKLVLNDSEDDRKVKLSVEAFADMI